MQTESCRQILDGTLSFIICTELDWFKMFDLSILRILREIWLRFRLV